MTRFRRVASLVCVILIALLVPVSIAVSWVRVQLVDEDAFVATLAPLADDPDVRGLVADRTSEVILETADVPGLTDDLFDGLQTLDLPRPALRALDLLREPAAVGATRMVEDAVARSIESDAFPRVWNAALVASHRALVLTATAEGDGALAIDEEGTVSIRLGPVVEAVTERLVREGVALARVIPATDRSIVVLQSDALPAIRAGYTVAVAAGLWLPVLTLAVGAAAVAIAPRRGRALRDVGIAATLGALVLLALLSVGDAALAGRSEAAALPPAATDALYDTVVAAMRASALSVAVIGVVLAAAGGLVAARTRRYTGTDTDARTEPAASTMLRSDATVSS
jgi:hypothetical protein